MDNQHGRRPTSSAEDESAATARGQALVEVLSFILDKMVVTNTHQQQHTGGGGIMNVHPPAFVTKFHAEKPPSISIPDYLHRIHKYAACSSECFVLSLIYIDRLIQRHGFVLTVLNVHRVILTSIVLAAKFFDDQYFNNAYYGKVGGVSCPEMNSLELEFLLLVNFSLHVTSEEYAKYYNELANHYVFAQALLRHSSMRSESESIRHYVMSNPEQTDQLMYVTEEPAAIVVPAPHWQQQPPVHHHVNPSRQSCPTLPTPNNNSQYSSHMMHHHSTISPQHPIQKCTGQKRRSAVALGVNG